MPHAITNGESLMDKKEVGSYAKTGIEVLIIGTGLAGLTAAIESVRKGHNVRVLERSASINLAGDTYFMGLSATRFFKHWPEMQKEYEQISLHNAWIETYKHNGEVVIGAKKVADRLAAEGLDPNCPPGTFQMRPLIYQMLLKQVERLNIPVEYNRKVVDYFEDDAKGKGGVILEDGTHLEADVILACDGVGSKAQKIVGGQVRARSSGRAVWRAAFPPNHLDQDPEVKEFFKMMPNNEPCVRAWLGPGTYALTLTREDTIVWVMNHDVTGSEAEDWNNNVDKEEVIKGMDEMKGLENNKWASIFYKLVQCTPPNTIVNLPLLWRDPQPSWTSPHARVVQIGDSAHSYLPASGNGATQAMEDAVSIISCLQIGGKENVPQSVRVHVRHRYLRNACAQKFGFVNADLLQNTDWDKVKINPRRAAPQHPKWVWQHDPEAYAYENYAKAAESEKKGVSMFEDRSYPVNYPEGYQWKPWSIDEIMEGKREGREVEVGAGNWA